MAVNGYNVAPTIDDEALKKATLTLRESNVTSFDTVESLVEEEVGGGSGRGREREGRGERRERGRVSGMWSERTKRQGR